MKRNRPTPKSQPAITHPEYIANTNAAQRVRLRDVLLIAPRTTTELRNQYAIMHPGGRVMELRRQGYNIRLEWIEQYDAAGVQHRAGRYRLIPEG